LSKNKFFLKFFNLTAKNIGIIFIASTLANLLNFLYQILMGRFLGPSEYGILTTLISLFYIASALTGTFQTSSTRYISAYTAQNNLIKIKNFFIKMTFRFFILSIIIFALIMILLKPVTSFLKMDSFYPLIILGVVIIIGSLNSVAAGTIQGMGKFKILGFNNTLGTFLKLLLGVIFIYLGLKSFGAILGIILSMLIAYVILLIPLKNILKLKASDNENSNIDIKDFYKSTFLILISTILLTLITYFDIILVKHFFSSADTGYFSAASQIGKIILFFPASISVVIFPRFSEKYEKNESLRGTFLKSILIFLATSIVFLLLYYFFPEQITKIIYGAVFIKITSKLIFLYGLYMTIIGLINLQVFYFISIKKFWYLSYLFIFILVEMILIFLYHDTLEIVIYIEIIISFLLFLINSIVMFALSRKFRSLKV
jgi:O-antigen/teichoic acid export membrane protein